MYIMPFTNVHPSGVGFASPRAFSEEHLANLEEYARIAHEQGALSIVQLAHAGLRSLPSADGQVVPLAPTGGYGWACSGHEHPAGAGDG